jgi:hypothetical protein
MPKTKWDPIFSAYLNKMADSIEKMGFRVKKRFDNKHLRRLQVDGLVGPALHITIAHKKVIVSKKAGWQYEGGWWACDIASPESYTQVIELFLTFQKAKIQLDKHFQAGTGHIGDENDSWDTVCSECFGEY